MTFEFKHPNYYKKIKKENSLTNKTNYDKGLDNEKIQNKTNRTRDRSSSDNTIRGRTNNTKIKRDALRCGNIAHSIAGCNLKDKALKDNSCTGIRLYVEQENKIAQSVYKKLEMKETHYKLFEIDFQD